MSQLSDLPLDFQMGTKITNYNYPMITITHYNYQLDTITIQLPITITITNYIYRFKSSAKLNTGALMADCTVLSIQT